MATYDQVKEILKPVLPTIKLRSQPVSHWQGDFALPDQVAEYFVELGPVDAHIPAYGNPYFLPSLSRLWDYQGGYRFHPDTGERFSGWNNDWLAIADDGGSVFIFCQRSTEVLNALHASGGWKPDMVFSSLLEMAGVFAVIGDIVVSAGRALTDENSIIADHYQDLAFGRVDELVGSQRSTRHILEVLGWF